MAESVLDGLDCSGPDPLRHWVEPALPLVTCEPAERAKHVLFPAVLTGTDIRRARAEPDQSGTGGWVVTIDFTDPAARIWADFTSQNVEARVAIVVDAQVVSAPTIQEAILGGTAVITGRFTRDQAERLAARIGSR
ncbi:MAG TPA: hypothetical protein VFV67_02195 [Actinophytocola sp.]|uniref:SecDF P1 head subdomain-containing protein n=1 Tax=Actinophytocola sp. TaxID=1872138 RepID=UPI002DB679F1|nr:hypothetical protein [Actinophytocola sp.]HEU5469436.1 hypothetical protein [Actinophytocola sp.]